MNDVKIPKYPNDFFDFSEGVNIEEDRINETIEKSINQLINNNEIKAVANSTGNMKVYIRRDDEMNGLEIEVYKNYQRKFIQL